MSNRAAPRVPTGRELIEESMQVHEATNDETGERIAWRTGKVKRALTIVLDTIPDADLHVLARRRIHLAPLQAAMVLLRFHQPPDKSAFAAPLWAETEGTPIRTCGGWLVALALEYDDQPMREIIDTLSHEFAHVYLAHTTDATLPHLDRECAALEVQVRWGFGRITLAAVERALQSRRLPPETLARLAEELPRLRGMTGER